MKNNEVTTLDGIMCICFAYGYYVGFMTLNVPIILLTEVTWISWVYWRKGNDNDER